MAVHRSLLMGKNNKMTYSLARYKKLKSEGRCVSCSGDLLKNHPFVECERCRQKHRDYEKDRSEQNRCHSCGKKAITGNGRKFCEVCWFKRKAQHHTGSLKNWRELKRLLEKQDSKCAYTGRTLTIGINASLDHKQSKHNGGTGDTSNLQWVDLEINIFKNIMSHNEFLLTIQEIFRYSLTK